MGKGFKHGAGGVKREETFNFTVNAYPSEVELNIATPAENTIGVVTANPIKGWHFSATQPENMAEGELWISVGVSSNAEFNAIKKNTIQIYPKSAKQMVSSALVDVTAKTYQNGEWIKWISTEYLMKQFEVNPDDFEFQNYEKGYGSWTITPEKINISGKLFSFQKKATVDLTGFNTVHFRINCNSTTVGQFHLCASKTSLMGNYLANLSAPAMVAPAATGEQELTLDVSNLTGLYYIGGKTSYRDNAGGSTTMDIFDIWMD